jgi:Glycosyltransferase family 87
VTTTSTTTTTSRAAAPAGPPSRPPPRALPGPSRGALACGAGALLLVAAAAALAWADDAPFAAQAGGRTAGDRDLSWLFLGGVAAAFVLHAAGFALLRSTPAARVRVVLALAVAIQAAPLAAPLLLSTDAWTYWSYGRIAAVLDGNPYRDPPQQFPGDPALPWVGAEWRDATTVYGPAFTLVSEPIALAAGESEDAAAWIFKTLAAAAVIACAVLAARLSRRPAAALAFVGWNPLLAVHFGGGGHNDAGMAALVLAALVLATAGRLQLAGALWALAALVKWIPLVLLPLWLLEARSLRRATGLAGLTVVIGAVGAVATWRYGTAWLEAAAPIARTATRETSYAVPHRLEQLGLPDVLALALPVALFVLAYLMLVRRALRGRARMGLAAGLLLFATPYLAPWYVIWTVPLAAAEDDGQAQLLALALGAYLLPQTIPL